MPTYVDACLQVNENMSFEAYIGTHCIERSEIKSTMNSSGKITNMSDFLNLLSYLKCTKLQYEDRINDAITILEEISSDKSENEKKIHFLIEQLDLIKYQRRGRRYSSFMIANAYLIYAYSTSTYKIILAQDILCMPSVRTLQNLASRIKKN